MAYTTFDPVKEDESGKLARQIIWSTDALKRAIDGKAKGKRLIANPFYENNTKLLKGELTFSRTPEEVKHFTDCMNDIFVFCKECKMMTPKGIRKVKLRDYQEDYLRHLRDNNMSIFLSCRQSGKTTTSALDILHFACFNTDKNILVLGNKLKTSKEILNKIQKMFMELPFYLRPGVIKWNETEIVFDNGCRIMGESTTVNSGISFTFHYVLADEFAHVAPNILEPFYNNLYPVITAAKAKFVITSTQNGFNLFYRLYRAAEKGENEYKPFKVDWWQVPEWNKELKIFEPRTEEWHKQQVSNLGSEENFQKQFGTSFDIKGNTLIGVKQIRTTQANATKFITYTMPEVINSDMFRFNPKYKLEDFKTHNVIATMDIAEGVSQDSTIVNFHIINKHPLVEGVEQVESACIFETNITEPGMVAHSMLTFIHHYCNYNNFLLSIELNLFGQLIIDKLNILTEKYKFNFDNSLLIKYPKNNITTPQLKKGAKGKPQKISYEMGLRITRNKSDLCSLFKLYFEQGRIINNDSDFCVQLENFSDNKGNGTYQAAWGHDDIIMTEVQLAAAMNTNQYKMLLLEAISSNNDQDSNKTIYDTTINTSDRIPREVYYDFNEVEYNQNDLSIYDMI